MQTFCRWHTPRHRKLEYLANRREMHLLRQKKDGACAVDSFQREYAHLLLKYGRFLPSRSHKTLLELVFLSYARKFIVREYTGRTTANEMESARSVNDIRKYIRDDVATNVRSNHACRIKFYFHSVKVVPPLWPDLCARNEFIRRVHFFPVPFFFLHHRNVMLAE